jgi:hypothetical protein
VKRQIDCFFKGLPQGYKRAVLAYELAQNGRYAQFDGLETLKNTKARVLLVYSENDRLVRKKLHYDPLYAALKDRENVSFLLEKKKGHNPNYTEEAVARLADYTKLLQKKQKKKELATEEARRGFVSSQDFKGMTEQDESVWQEIFEVLKA